jgi:hypothetical protein
MYLITYILTVVRVRLGLRFQNSDFKMYDLKKVIFKNAVKHLAKSQFGL